MKIIFLLFEDWNYKLKLSLVIIWRFFSFVFPVSSAYNIHILNSRNNENVKFICLYFVILHEKCFHLKPGIAQLLNFNVNI